MAACHRRTCRQRFPRARTSDVLLSLLHLSALIAQNLLIISIFKCVGNPSFCLHCVCTTCTSCLHYLHTACTLCTTCTTYLHCHSVMSVTGFSFFGRSDRFVYLPQLFVLRNTTCTARFRYKSAGSAGKVQTVQTVCRFLSGLSTHHFSLNINAFNTFSADKSNYGHKMPDARARESEQFLCTRGTLRNSINDNIVR